jgi:hypothetical protein
MSERVRVSTDIFSPRRRQNDSRRWVSVFLAAGILVLSSEAESILAHETWAKGTPVPPWVKSWCCSVADAHRLSLGQIRRVDGGWSVEGFAHIVPDDRVSPLKRRDIDRNAGWHGSEAEALERAACAELVRDSKVYWGKQARELPEDP